MPDLDGLPVSAKELELLRQLTNAEVPFMLVGLGAAVVQGADAVTKDIDLWFRSTAHPGVAEAARRVGAVFAWRNNPPSLIRREPSGDDMSVSDNMFDRCCSKTCRFKKVNRWNTPPTE